MNPMSRWLMAGAIFVAGAGVLATAVRERGRAARGHRAPRPSTIVLPEGGSGETLPSESPIDPEIVRSRFRDGSAAERRDLLREATGTLSNADARQLVVEVLLDSGASPSVRLQALELLSRVRASAAEDVELLRGLLADRTFPAPYLVVRALGTIDDPAARTLLMDGLRAGLDDSSRVQAARALSSHASEGSIAGVLRDAALSDANEGVRMAALTALFDGGGAGAAELARQIAGLPSTPVRLRLLALRQLAK